MLVPLDLWHLKVKLSLALIEITETHSCHLLLQVFDSKSNAFIYENTIIILIIISTDKHNFKN